MQYELFYLVGEDKEPALEKIKGEVKKAVEDEKCQWLETQIMEKRKMAYKIKGQFRGIYIAQRFEIPENEESEGKEELRNISKKMNLNPNILRFIIVKTDDLPELKLKRLEPEAEKAAPVKEIRKPEIEKEAKKPVKEEDIDAKLEEILKI
jgi:ribosomal protein S6